MFLVKLLKGGLHFKSILFVCFSFFSQPFQLLWLKALRSKLKDMPGSLYFIAFYLPFFDNGPFKDKMHFSKGKGRTKAFPFPQQQQQKKTQYPYLLFCQGYFTKASLVRVDHLTTFPTWKSYRM